MSISSKPSRPVYFINVPKLFDDNTFTNLSCKFIYNFYTTDESTQENPIIPEVYKKPTISKNDVSLSTFSLRVPRYVEISWKSNDAIQASPLASGVNPDLQKNLSKIVTQDNILNSNFLPYSLIKSNKK